jgi:hypothetical protein
VADWDDLERELDAWAKAGREATLWWRDDDARTLTPALERLLGLSGETGTPIAIAVVPLDADAGLAERLSRFPLAAVLQHGYAHLNHAPGGVKKAELGAHRDTDSILAELARGRRLLAPFEGALPVLVPPWNRMDPNLLARLPTIGLEAVSAYKARPAAEPAPGVRRANAHADLFYMKGHFIGVRAVLKLIVDHLAARRKGLVDGDEATGLLTHHLELDDAGWAFVGKFLGHTRDHAAVRWIGGRQVFWP